MRIALAFPELSETHGRDGFDWAARELKRAARTGGGKQKPDLLVLPEGFEEIRISEADQPASREDFLNLPRIAKTVAGYQRLADQTGTAIVSGIYLDAGGESRPANGSNFDSWAIAIRPCEAPIAYHKHATSRGLAMNDEDWAKAASLPVFEVAGEKVGLSVCHDMYLSPIPKALADQGATVWLNPSYQNVRPHIWQAMLQARAEENGLIAVNPLFRNSGASNPQAEPYVIAPEGKVTLADNGLEIGALKAEQRTGRFWTLDTDAMKTTALPIRDPQPVAPKATGSIAADGSITGVKHRYAPIEVDLKTFLDRPDRLWRKVQSLCKTDPDATPVFDIRVRDRSDFERAKTAIGKIMPSRMMEFSTLAVIRARKDEAPLMTAYRSSNYKDVRLDGAPGALPLNFDERYLFGPEKTLALAGLDDPENSAALQRFTHLLGGPAPTERPLLSPRPGPQAAKWKNSPEPARPR